MFSAAPLSSATADAPLLVRLMYLDVSGWERRRARGRRRFVRDITAVGIVTSVGMTASVALDAWRTGRGLGAMFEGTSLFLLVVGLAAPIVLRAIAPIEWRTIEARYALEAARRGQVASPAVD